MPLRLGPLALLLLTFQVTRIISFKSNQLDASALSTSNAQLKNYAVKDDIEYTLAVYNPNFQTVTVTYSIDFQPTGGFIVARGFLIAVIVGNSLVTTIISNIYIVGGVALLSSIGLILWCIKRRREYQRSFEYQKYYSTTSNA